MKKYLNKFSIICLLSLLVISLAACSNNRSEENTKHHRVDIVTSTNIYADIAKQVVGKHGKVVSIINNGNTDPHDFEPTAASAKEVAQANIVIANGLGYDSWMDNLASSNNLKLTKVGNDLMHKKNGDNPHIWYDLNMPQIYVSYIVKRASKIDPKNASYFKKNGQNYLKKINSIKALANKIDGKNSKPVFVSEPVFDYALERCHFKIGDRDFEEAVENETDPSGKSIYQMQNSIRNHKIAFFVNNEQASSSTVNSFVKLCHQYKIPVLNVRETMPNGTHYYQWMKSNFERLKKIN